MTGTQKPKPSPKGDAEPINIGHNVCGIVMPISQMSEEYSAAHWGRVRKILETAVIRANFTPKVVWDNPELDVIQSKILQNIYDNEIIICDLSNLNPNVMLEAGLRLSTKKPTILVTDNVKKPPFDISAIEYIPYKRDLEYNSIELFITELSKKISSVSNSYRSGSYKSFIDSYQFEIAKPETIEVSSDKYIIDQINDLRLMFEKYVYSIAKNNIDSGEEKEDISFSKIRFKYIGRIDSLMKIFERFSSNDLKLLQPLDVSPDGVGGFICINSNEPLKYARIKKILMDKGMKFP